MNSTILNSITPLDDWLEPNEVYTLTFPSIMNSNLTNSNLTNSNLTLMNSNLMNSNLTNSNISWGITNTTIGPGDIFLDNSSLRDRLASIEKRIAEVEKNSSLELKYPDLKKIGDEYSKLRTELIEKEKILEILKR